MPEPRWKKYCPFAVYIAIAILVMSIIFQVIINISNNGTTEEEYEEKIYKEAKNRVDRLEKVHNANDTDFPAVNVNRNSVLFNQNNKAAVMIIKFSKYTSEDIQEEFALTAAKGAFKAVPGDKLKDVSITVELEGFPVPSLFEFKRDDV